jgi:signal transduction histidine kinase
MARILVVDGEPGLIDDYRLALCPVAGGAVEEVSAGLEEDLFASALCHEGLPGIELVACCEAAEAVEAVDRSTGQQRPFALAFVDPRGAQGLEAVTRMRALDPKLHVVIVTAAPDIDALELSERVPPADRLYYLQKPFHAVEIRQLALALSERWRGERETAGDPSRAPEAGPADAPESSPAGVLVFDAGDRLLSANRTIGHLFPELAAFFVPGSRYEEIQWQMARQLLPKDTLYRVHTWVRDRLEWHAAGGGLFEQRLRGSRWILLAEARAEAGGTTCHFHDITELKQREGRRAAAARLTQMSQALAGLCDRLHLEPEAAGAGQGDGKVVSLHAGAKEGRSAGGRFAGPDGREINSLLGKVRAVAQRQRLLPERLDLNATVTEFVQAGDFAFPATVGVEVVAGAGLWPVQIDRDGFAAALGELARNACDAMPAGGHLTLEVANADLGRDGPAQADYVRLSVRDTGPGMPPEFAERALNPFFTTKAEAAHLGLGLSTVHGFVSQSGGRLELTTGDGQGTRVDLYFPRAVASAGVGALINGPAHRRPSDGPGG